MNLTIRPFQDSDYPRLAQIEAAIDPAHASSAELLRERDAVNEPRVRVLHLAAEHDSGELVGMARVSHIWWNFNPRNYMFRVVVDPEWQRRGVGSALLDRLLAELRTWNAALLRGETRDSRPGAISFLEHRGFHEWKRRWESVLPLTDVDTTSLVRADQRLKESGVTITTYMAERERRGDRLAHDVWELEDAIARADPNAVDEGEGMSFERFAAAELDHSGALPDGHFLALVGDKLVGVSRLAREHERPDAVDQAFTGTHPGFRGLGIAQALKLRTVEYARAHGYHEIHTSNDSTNEPMLHINIAMGFRRGPAIIVFERQLA